MATKKQEIVKAEDNSALPDYLRERMPEGGALGMESLDESDFVLPRVKLLQSTDIIVQNGDGVSGEYYHVTSKQSLGKELAFVPIMVRKRYMLFVPQDSQSSGSKVLARADDGINWNTPNAKFEVTLKNKKKVVWDLKGSVAESGLDQFGSEDPEDPQSRPAALLIYDIIAMLPDYPELSPVSISLKGAAISRAKSFFTGIKQARMPLWFYRCKTWGTIEKNGNNSYWNYNLAGDGWAPKEIVVEAEKIYNMAQEKSFRAADDDEDVRAESASAKPTGKNNGY